VTSNAPPEPASEADINQVATHKLERWANIIGGYATALAAIVGVATLFAVYFQIAGARAIQIEANAREHFREFLVLSYQSPAFTEAVEYDQLDQVVSSERPEAGSERQRYVVYVAFALSACDEILGAFSSGKDSEVWERTCRQNLSQHIMYLASSDFSHEQFCTYTLATRTLINDLRRQDFASCA